jgi:uncharacterized membrane protein YeiH
METEPHNSYTNPSPQTTRLIEVLQDLETHIKRQNSLRFAFFRGLAYGFGMVLGATVLVAIFGSIVATMFGGLLTDTLIGEITSQAIE